MKLNMCYPEKIKHFTIGCLIFALFAFSNFSAKATDLKIAHLLVGKSHDNNYFFSGYILNTSADFYAGPVTLVAKIRGEDLQYPLGDFKIPNGDSAWFEGTAILDITAKQGSGKMWTLHASVRDKESTTLATFDAKVNQSNPSGPATNNKYENILFCVWVLESDNQSGMSCIFTVGEDYYYLALKNGYRKGRTEPQKTENDFSEKIDLSFKVYPNPLVNITYLLVNSLNERIVNIQIINNVGETLKQYNTSLSKGSEFVEVDMNDFGPGVYFFKVSENNNIATTKAVKTN